jgi:ankyrin repeat protein
MSLFDACRNGDVEMVKLLTKDENDFKSPKFWLLIELACTHGHVEVIEHIYEKCHDIQVFFEPHFIAAVKKGHLRVVKFLADKGIVHTNNDYALIWAASSGHLEVVKYLVEKGLDIHFKDDNALIWAASNGHFEVVKYLVEKGADIHAKDDQPCQYACVFGHFKIAKYLLEKGAHIHAGNDYGFRRACHNGHFQVSRFLIEKGCDISLIPEIDRNKVMRYITLCGKVEKRAANKIGSWWIPICYDLNRECGKRMMERSWERVKAMYEAL